MISILVPIPSAGNPVALTRASVPLAWTSLSWDLARHNSLIGLSSVNVVADAIVLWCLWRSRSAPLVSRGVWGRWEEGLRDRDMVCF
jgi:hypothetical protein